MASGASTIVDAYTDEEEIIKEKANLFKGLEQKLISRQQSHQSRASRTNNNSRLNQSRTSNASSTHNEKNVTAKFNMPIADPKGDSKGHNLYSDSSKN